MNSFRSNQKKTFIRANERIRVPEIRLIDEKGEQVGIVSVKEGLQRAEEAGLDLVEVAASAKPPVCRILDLGKYVYDLSKKEKEAKKKQKNVDVKEVKLSAKIGEHDYQTKLRNAIRFIKRGDRVKLSMFFRGREITHTELGREIIDRFKDDMSDVADVERDDGLDGRMIHIYFIPKKSAGKKAADQSTDSPEADERAQVKEGS